MTAPLRVLAIATALVVAASGAMTGRSSTPPTSPAGQREQRPAATLPQTFTALAVNLNATSPAAAAATLEIGVERWSTDADRETLYNTLVEQGPEKLLLKLQSMPKVGYIRTPESIGYDLHFARDGRAGDDERIVLATDRPIGAWEAWTRPQVSDYPFTVIELRLKPNGEGEGKLSLATRITADQDDHSIVLENYSISPVMLTSVKRDRR